MFTLNSVESSDACTVEMVKVPHQVAAVGINGIRGGILLQFQVVQIGPKMLGHALSIFLARLSRSLEEDIPRLRFGTRLPLGF